MMSRDSFVFNRSFLDALEGLDADTQNEFFMAIAQYALNGILPSFTGLKQAVWAQIKYSLDSNTTKYEKRKSNSNQNP